MEEKINEISKSDKIKKFKKDSQIFETAYEKVLSIINKAKDFIKNHSESSQKLLDDLEWVIEIIANKSLYSYELNKDKITKKNSEYNRFIGFVTQYNDEIIKLNHRHILISSLLGIGKKGEILLKPSLCLKKTLPSQFQSKEYIKEKEAKEKKRKSIIKIGNMFLNLYNKENAKKEENKENEKKEENMEIEKKEENKEIEKKEEENKENDKKEENKENDKKEENIQNDNDINKNIKEIEDKNFDKNSGQENKITDSININVQKDEIITEKENNSDKDSNDKENIINKPSESDNSPEEIIKKNKTDELEIKRLQSDLSIKIDNDKITETDNNTETIIKEYKTDEIEIKEIQKDLQTNEDKSENKGQQTKEGRTPILTLMDQYINDVKEIADKNFNIFDFKEKVGYKNVLPIMCHVIMNTLGLYDPKVISIKKLDSFLFTVSDNYKESTLYHNSLHGADVTQTLCLFFINSNAEQILETTVLDLLGIIVSAIGHDLGHPGTNNNFHINACTDLALTYNDSSCLENYHTSFLFKILKKDENNILEKFSKQNFKSIRKRMINQILATDMANHGEVVSLIRAKINSSVEEGETTFKLLSGNEKTKFDEQQMLLNYFIHSADLAHNAKPFEISLKWVELLSEEFWLQGDLEKSKGMTISFLCDRNKVDIPASQIGFIRGFVITIFDNLVAMFPTLNYTIDNAMNNINEWKKLQDQHRLRGWTPEKKQNKNEEKI